MKKIYLAFLVSALIAGFTKMQAQALVISPSDTFTYTGTLTNSTQSGMEQDGAARNQSGQNDTICWKAMQCIVDSNWLGMSFCDPNSCYDFYYSTTPSYAEHLFLANSGQSYRIYFNSSPNCVADSGELQIQMWLEHDSAASATVLTYKARSSGSCTTGINPIAGNNFSNVNLYPNPANNQINIQFGLTQSAPVAAYVTNIMGQRIADIFSGQLSLGAHKLSASAANFANGFYFLTLKTGDTEVTQRFVVAK